MWRRFPPSACIASRSDRRVGASVTGWRLEHVSRAGCKPRPRERVTNRRLQVPRPAVISTSWRWVTVRSCGAPARIMRFSSATKVPRC